MDIYLQGKTYANHVESLMCDDHIRQLCCAYTHWESTNAHCSEQHTRSWENVIHLTKKMCSAFFKPDKSAAGMSFVLSSVKTGAACFIGGKLQDSWRRRTDEGIKGALTLFLLARIRIPASFNSPCGTEANFCM